MGPGGPPMGPGGPPPGPGSLPVVPRYLMISHYPSHLCSTSRTFGHRKWKKRYRLIYFEAPRCLCDLGCRQAFDESVFGFQDSYLKRTFFDVAHSAEQVHHPQLVQCKWFNKGLEPNAEGSSWHCSHWNPIRLVSGGAYLKTCHLHSWISFDCFKKTGVETSHRRPSLCSLDSLIFIQGHQ